MASSIGSLPTSKLNWAWGHCKEGWTLQFADDDGTVFGLLALSSSLFLVEYKVLMEFAIQMRFR